MRLLELILIVGTLAAAAAVAIVCLVGLVVWLSGGKADPDHRRMA